MDEKLLSAPDVDVIKKDLDPFGTMEIGCGNSSVPRRLQAEWSNLKEGDNESVLQDKQRTTNLLSTLKIVGL